MGLHSRLFTRILARNRYPYLLKIITLAIAFASSVLTTLFALNEFGYDRSYRTPDAVFRILQKNTDEGYRGNRLSVKIPTDVVLQLKKADSLVISRVKIMNDIVIHHGNSSFPDQKVHAADPEIFDIFSFDILDGNANGFNSPGEITAMLSSSAALRYTGTIEASGKKVALYTFGDTIQAKIVAVFRDFPDNSHEDFDVFIAYNPDAITALHFHPEETGVYGRALKKIPEHAEIPDKRIRAQPNTVYSFQPLPSLYFGPRVPGEEARHGDRYSVIILVTIASLILFLALTGFVNLTTITLPHRSKELAVKKFSGTSPGKLLYGFLKESSALVGLSILIGLLILICTSAYIGPVLGIQVLSLIVSMDAGLLMIIAGMFIVLTVPPVFMTLRFVLATPTRLLSTDTITFPGLKRVMTVLQLGVSIFLIIASVVVRRQINYSLVKEPGQNHDQIVYFNSPTGITNEGIFALRSGWKKYNPNILDVMAVSQLPDRVNSKEVDSDFYSLRVDPGFREFFGLAMKEGNWFKVNDGDSIIVINQKGKDLQGSKQSNVIGVAEDLGARYNQPEKPLKIRLAQDHHYNWLCVRVLEVDIRRTVDRLSDSFSFQGQKPHVNFLSRHFKSWLDYQDKLNKLSEILTLIAALLSCFAIYGLSVSLVRDKLKQIAVHKLYGAETLHITILLVSEFGKQMIIALIFFAPLTYILLRELLRTFVYATKFSWLDPVYPIAYCTVVIFVICGFQALTLHRSDFVAALKG